MMYELFGKKVFVLGERDKDKEIIEIAKGLPLAMEYGKYIEELITKDGFFFFSQKEYSIDNCCNMYQIRKAIELLEGLEVIATKRVGSPARVYVKVLEQSIVDEVENYHKKSHMDGLKQIAHYAKVASLEDVLNAQCESSGFSEGLKECLEIGLLTREEYNKVVMTNE